MLVERWAIDEVTESEVTVLHSPGVLESGWQMPMLDSPNEVSSIMEWEREASKGEITEQALVVSIEALRLLINSQLRGMAILESTTGVPRLDSPDLIDWDVREGDVYWVGSESTMEPHLVLQEPPAPEKELMAWAKQSELSVWEVTAVARRVSSELYRQLAARDLGSRPRRKRNRG